MDDRPTEAKARDELFERLLHRRSWLRALARTIVTDAAEADDVVQDACIAALERRSVTSGTFDPWLRSVVRRLALLIRRREGRLRQREERAARPERLPSTADLVERIDTEQRLAAGIVALAEPFRTTILLRFYEGLSAAEIARRQEIPEGTVRWRTKRGIDELRARLERDFGGSEALGIALVELTRGHGPTPSASSPFDAASGGTVTIAELTATGVGAVVAAKWLAVGAIGIVLAATWIGVTQWMPRSGSESSEVRREGRIAANHAAGSDQVGTSSPQAPAAKSERIPMAIEESSQRSSVAAKVIRLRILESDGSPNAGKLAVLKPKRGEAELVSGLIDENGWIEFEATGQKRELAIERADAFPYRSLVELSPSERTIELPEGEVLSGRIVVDGGVPPRPIELELFEAPTPEAEVMAGTSDPRHLLFVDIARSRTDARGMFLFSGLASRTGYGLRFPQGYAWPGQREYSGPHLRLTRWYSSAGSGLLIELERHIVLHGRLVESDGVTPVDAGLVEARLTWMNGTNMDTDARTASDGVFEMFLQKRPRAASVRFGADLGRRGSGQAEFAFESSEGDLNIGDLRLTRGRDLLVRVVSSKGAPIAGARANLGGITDERGELMLADVGTATRTIRFGARGYRHSDVEVSEELAGALEVTLEPTNGLSVEVRDRDRVPVGGITVELRGFEDLFQEGPVSSMPYSDRSESGSFQSYSPGRGEEVSVARFTTSERGRFFVGGLREGLDMELVVLDSSDRVVHREMLEPLEKVEERSVRVAIKNDLRPLRGRLLDPDGNPVCWAMVQVTAPGGMARRNFASGNGGDFEIPFLTAGEIHLFAAKRGFRSRTWNGFVPSEASVDVLLERGLDAVVRVQDVAGRAVAGGRVGYRRSGEESWMSARAVGDGRFELLALEDELHDVQLSLAGLTLEAVLDPRRGGLTFDVPQMGALEASWDLVPDERACDDWIELRLVPKAQPRDTIQELFVNTPKGGHLFETLLPGEYELTLVRQEDDGVLLFAMVTVLAGETTQVVLKP